MKQDKYSTARPTLSCSNSRSPTVEHQWALIRLFQEQSDLSLHCLDLSVRILGITMAMDLIIWTASSEFGTYRLCEQRRFRRACASKQSRQNLRCSLIQAVSQEEPSDRKPDPWPLWMAGHAQLTFVMTECSKTQIRLTGLILHGVLSKFQEKACRCSCRIVWREIYGPRQANLVLIAYASSEGSGEPAHPRSLARTFAARSYRQWVKRKLQTESQIPGPLWMAGHAQLTFVMTECSKTQIRLTGLILFSNNNNDTNHEKE